MHSSTGTYTESYAVFKRVFLWVHCDTKRDTDEVGVSTRAVHTFFVRNRRRSMRTRSAAGGGGR